MIELPAKLKSEVDFILASSDRSELLKQLKTSLEISVEHVVRLAALIRRLEELGVQIEIEIPALPFIRKIAYGQMVPQLFVSLQGAQRLLEKTASLPMPDQKNVAENKPFRVMELGGDYRLVPPLSMTSREIQQVFYRGQIRDDASQVGWLREHSRKAVKCREEPAEIKLDRKRGGIVIDGRFLSASELAHYLAELGQRKRYAS